MTEWWIKRSWTRLWWVAINPNEVLAEIDWPTCYRAWTRKRLIFKLIRLSKPKTSRWGKIHV